MRSFNDLMDRVGFPDLKVTNDADSNGIRDVVRRIEDLETDLPDLAFAGALDLGDEAETEEETDNGHE